MCKVDHFRYESHDSKVVHNQVMVLHRMCNCMNLVSLVRNTVTLIPELAFGHPSEWPLIDATERG